MLFFAGAEDQLAKASQLVVDYPGGGFIAMGPECHEERLRRWAKRTGKPVLGIDYGKAPECERTVLALTTAYARSLPLGDRRGIRRISHAHGDEGECYRDQERQAGRGTHGRFCVRDLSLRSIPQG